MTPYLEGDELDKYQSNFSDRRIFVISFPNIANFGTDEQKNKEVLNKFQERFGRIESSYFRNMPRYDKSIFVVIFSHKGSKYRALEFYYSDKALA